MTKEDCVERRMETSMEKSSPGLLLTAALGKRNKTTHDTKIQPDCANARRRNSKAPRKTIVVIGSRRKVSRQKQQGDSCTNVKTMHLTSLSFRFFAILKIS